MSQFLSYTVLKAFCKLKNLYGEICTDVIDFCIDHRSALIGLLLKRKTFSYSKTK